MQCPGGENAASWAWSTNKPEEVLCAMFAPYIRIEISRKINHFSKKGGLLRKKINNKMF
jgi:hypothetical protein